MEVIGFTNDGTIEFVINGETMFAPDVPGNRFRDMIAEWEAEGNTIPAYVPPVIPRSVRMAYFRIALKRIGKLEAVDAAVASHPDPESIELWTYASWVHESNPVVIQIAAALSVDLTALFDSAVAIGAEQHN